MTENAKPMQNKNTKKQNLNQNLRTAHMCAYHCALMVINNTAQNSSFNLPSQPPNF